MARPVAQRWRQLNAPSPLASGADEDAGKPIRTITPADLPIPF
jgi:hypothetical protein